MSKAVLISIHPKWCGLIASGKKTIEVRKTRPQIKTPFKCYIYCTKPSKEYQTICGCFVLNSDELFRHPRKGIKYGDSIELMAEDDYTKDNFLNGKVIGEFVCDRITDIHLTDEGYDFDVPKMTSLKYEEMEAYLGRKNGYGWHISALKVYDKPKTLQEFNLTWETIEKRNKGKMWVPMEDMEGRIKRPPQSWMYVEEKNRR